MASAAALDVKTPFDILNGKLAQEVRAYDPGTQEIQNWTLYAALKQASEAGDSLISLMESRRLAHTRSKNFTQRTIEEAQDFAEKLQVFRDLSQAAISVCKAFTRALTDLKQTSTDFDVKKIKADLQKAYPDVAAKVQDTYDKHSAEFGVLKGREAEITKWKTQLDGCITLMDAKFNQYCQSLGIKAPGVFAGYRILGSTPVSESLIFKKDSGGVLEAAKCVDELSIYLMGVTDRSELAKYLLGLSQKFETLAAETDFVSISCKPNVRVLEKKVAPKMKQIQLKIDQLDQNQKEKLLNGEAVEIDIEGEKILLTPKDVVVERQANGNLVARLGEGITVALNNEVEEDLLLEVIASG